MLITTRDCSMPRYTVVSGVCALYCTPVKCRCLADFGVEAQHHSIFNRLCMIIISIFKFTKTIEIRLKNSQAISSRKAQISLNAHRVRTPTFPKVGFLSGAGISIPRKHVNQVNLGQSPAPTTAQTRLIRSVDSNSALATLVEL
jgi:hypothetical protein